MPDVTQILSQIEQGDPQAAEKLLPLVYDELRKLAAVKLAQEKPGQTLQATALVHEAYVRLVAACGEAGQEAGESGNAPGDENRSPDSSAVSPASFASRIHFFAAAAEAMRRILIDRAREKRAIKRGGNLAHAAIELDGIAAPERSDDLLAVDDALQKLETIDPKGAQLVKLRYFVGMTIPEAADALGVSPRTADAWWAYAKAWLMAELGDVE
jgi:RNA polymerase sigma factor (sigma-70 family)